MKSILNIGLYSLMFALVLTACGSIAPDVGQNSCEDNTVTASNSQNQSATISTTANTGIGGAGGSTGFGGTVDPSSSASNTGGSTPQPKYDSPTLDEITSRLHSCHKLTYAQLGTLLRNRGAAIPNGLVQDLKNTQVQIFGATQTLGNVFGGSGSNCEMAITDANGTNDPICPSNETCFCNQDDKVGMVNKSCLDVGNNSPDAADGFCVSKPATAGYLYFTGKDALGYPKLDSRLGEKEEHSTASAMKVMDIFIQAAPQIIANITDPVKAPACTLNGKNKPMFASDGSCVEESVSCLIGLPATADHMLLCNLIVQKANPNDMSDILKKRNIAVAVLLSAAHSCQ
jgi:hypothetical protein